MSIICQACINIWEYNDEQDLGLSWRTSQPGRETSCYKAMIKWRDADRWVNSHSGSNCRGFVGAANPPERAGQG